MVCLGVGWIARLVEIMRHYIADDALDEIQRYTSKVVAVITDHSGNYSTDVKIHHLELYVGTVQNIIEGRPPIPWWRRNRKRWYLTRLYGGVKQR